MITSTSNKRVKWVHALQTKRKARGEEQVFVIEGVRLADEALSAQIPARLVLHSEGLDNRGRGLVNRLARLGAEVELISEKVMAFCSATQSPPGLIAVLSTPQLPLPEQPTLALVVDRLRDPGNLGSLMRSAVAAGVEALYLTEGTVDPYNPKVVRGGMGAHFHMPIVYIDPSNIPEVLTAMELWLAEPHVGTPYDQVDWKPPVALVVGGEASGPGLSLREQVENRTYIPMKGPIESLNVTVAASLILFEINRQRGI